MRERGRDRELERKRGRERETEGGGERQGERERLIPYVIDMMLVSSHPGSQLYPHGLPVGETRDLTLTKGPDSFRVRSHVFREYMALEGRLRGHRSGGFS